MQLDNPHSDNIMITASLLDDTTHIPPS